MDFFDGIALGDSTCGHILDGINITDWLSALGELSHVDIKVIALWDEFWLLFP